MSHRNFERRRVLADTSGESRTKQADAAGANINTMMAQWLKTGIPPQSNKEARYGNFENAEDYLSCMTKVAEAEAEFMRLSPAVRKACGQDPGKFLDLVFDPERREELVELGLMESQVPEAVDEGSPAVPEAPEEPEVPA